MKKVLTIAPDDAQALNYLGYTYAELGIKLDEALQYLRKAVELRPNDGFILDSLGWVYFKLKRYDEAIPLLERATKLVDDDLTIMEHLADAYAARREHRKALDLYRKILETEPGRKDIIEKKRKVRGESQEK